MPPLTAEPPTRSVRLPTDLAEMLGWINDIEGDTAATVVEPLIREHVQARFDRIRPRVEAIKAARSTRTELGNPVG